MHENRSKRNLVLATAFATILTLAILVVAKTALTAPLQVQTGGRTASLHLQSTPAYHVVYSVTYPARIDTDGVVPHSYVEINDDGSRRRVRVGSAVDQLGDTEVRLVATDVVTSYYQEHSLLRIEDIGVSQDAWFNPLGADYVITPDLASEIMTGERMRSGWNEVQAHIDNGLLAYLGEDSILDESVRGALWSYGGDQVEGWFSVPDGLRMSTVVTQSGNLVMREAASVVDLNASLDEDDFEIETPIVWGTIAFRTREIDSSAPPPSIHGYAPTLIQSSADYGVTRTFSIERDYLGVYSYEHNHWSGAGVDPEYETIGWMVVQDVIDQLGMMIRIIQSEAGEDIPYGGFPGWPYYAIMQYAAPPHASRLVVVPGSSNPIVRDEFQDDRFTWLDEQTNGQYLVVTQVHPADDSYLVDIVTELMSSRP